MRPGASPTGYVTRGIPLPARINGRLAVKPHKGKVSIPLFRVSLSRRLACRLARVSQELHKQVCRIANVMKAQGVKKGDVVMIYMPMVPEIAMVMLACARLGAPHR